MVRTGVHEVVAEVLGNPLLVVGEVKEAVETTSSKRCVRKQRISLLLLREGLVLQGQPCTITDDVKED